MKSTSVLGGLLIYAIFGIAGQAAQAEDGAPPVLKPTTSPWGSLSAVSFPGVARNASAPGNAVLPEASHRTAAASNTTEIASSTPTGSASDPGDPAGKTHDDPSARSVQARDKAGGVVDINTASVGALNHLPGQALIGNAIVQHRPYRSVHDLVARRVLRESDFQRVRSSIRVD